MQETIEALHVYSGKSKDEILLDLKRDYTWMFFWALSHFKWVILFC
ncbi:MAG: hypothetical protein A4E62_02208 [Syntrophorhabdus sp. PtaU1.Bin002]|nr:MAG: hypothetical protein A4E62_02208 [Syntrophorhabdus sp. PtaU1.Bin002]